MWDMGVAARARWARLRERRADRRATRAERRTHQKGDFTDHARRAEGQAWSKGGSVYK